jgi:mevalonate kinase
VGATGRAFGKLILFGEHAAVYGYPAVGVSLPESTTVRMGDSALPAWELESIPPADRGGVGALLGLLEEILPGLAAKGRRHVQLESEVARMSGFGSSAALCGAFARAALALAGEEPGGEATRAWSLAHQAERLFHGTPSGVDTGLAMIGGTCVLRPRPPGLPAYSRIPARGLHLAVGALPRDAACAALVGGLAARMRSGDDSTRASIDALGHISAEASETLSTGGPRVAEALGVLAVAAMDRLRSLGLSNADVERLLEEAAAAGALGAKLSGAGGGGAVFAIAPDRDHAAFIASRMEAAAAESGMVLASAFRVIEV